MKNQTKILLFILIFVSFQKTVFAQNPFEQFGYEVKIVTMTNGKFNEFFDLDTIQQIGDVLINTNTMKMIGFAEKDSINPRPDASVISRWISPDPLAEEYYFISPYAYVANNPIIFIDPDGRDIEIWYIERKETEFNFFGVSFVTGYEEKNASWIFDGTNASDAPKNEFIQDFLTAYEYNTSNGGGDNLKEAATNSDIAIELVQSDENDSYNVDFRTVVRWNPSVGLKTKEGHILSAATNLEHEFDHGVAAQTNYSNFFERYRTADKDYDDKEERRVITGSEQKTAKANNEIKSWQVTRRDHKGTHVKTKNVTSTEEKK